MSQESRVRYTSEEAVNQVGNRFDLVLIAAQRVRELHRGHRTKLSTKSGPAVTALEEIEAGLVGREYLKRLVSDSPKSLVDKRRY